MKLFLLGGFLGSGKTTAILQAATALRKQGRKVGVITNDQGEKLVDTRFVRQHDIAVEEVTGSCFCCNFGQLSQSIQALKAADHPDIIFAESVGSCTDLVATIIKPLQKYYKEIDVVLSVFTDIRLLGVFLQRNKEIFHGNMNYIYEKQLEEADIIVVNKADTLSSEHLHITQELIDQEKWISKLLYQNSLDPSDIAQWIKTMDDFQIPALRKSLDIDYEQYAIGEAEMAWYDSEVEIRSEDGSAGEIAYRLLLSIYDKMNTEGCIIGHLKFMLSDESRQRKLSFTTIPIAQDLDYRFFGRSNRIDMMINGRVKASPAWMDQIIGERISDMQVSNNCSIQEKHKKSFRPGYPKPTHRMLG